MVHHEKGQPILAKVRLRTSTWPRQRPELTMSTNLLPNTTGIVGTLSFGISLRDCSLLILFFRLICTLPAGYFNTIGSRTGLRQMLHAIYTFGFYLISLTGGLNRCTIAGFSVIDCVLRGLTLSAVSSGEFNDTVGIVIIALISVILSFGAYRALHQYERYSWIFALITITVATGVSGKELSKQVETTPASAATIIGFGGVMAGFLIPWAAMAADFTVYCDPWVTTLRIFAYTYAGLFLPTVRLMVLGAVIGGATQHSILVTELLVPFFVRLPRFMFSIVYTIAAIPVPVAAAKPFFASLENFIYLITYWSAAFVAVVTMEHFAFRKSDCRLYIVEIGVSLATFPLELHQSSL